MKLKSNKLLLLSFLMSPITTFAAPINDECVNDPTASNKDCPNDPLFTQAYAFDYMNMAYAWDLSFGTAKVGVLERGNYTTPSLKYSRELGQKIRTPDSGNYRCNNFNSCPGQYSTDFSNTFTAPNTTFRHGDYVLSLLGAKTDNEIGLSSFCRECSLTFSTAEGNYRYAGYDTLQELNNRDLAEWLNRYNFSTYQAFKNMVYQGNQIINLSGGFGYVEYGNTYSVAHKCDEQRARTGYVQSVCSAIKTAKARDVLFVVSGGNNKGVYQWPANESDYVLGVGGSDKFGNIWDEGCYGYECGSSLGYPMVMAPAKDVIVYNQGLNENCDPDDDVNDCYQSLSGTSFSAPIISGIASIIRTLNPLISVDEIKVFLINSRRTTNADGITYSIPNIAQIIKKNVLGFSKGKRVKNRVKPMFRTKYRENNSNGESYYSYMSTTIPQVVVAGISAQYLGQIDGDGKIDSVARYTPDSLDPLALGYTDLRGSNQANNARAPFYIFGGHENPFTGVDDMKPLYHYGYREATGFTHLNGCEDAADHAYSTTTLNEFGANPHLKCSYTSRGGFSNEGIEGYLLSSCPVKGGCYEDNSDHSAPQCLMVRYSVVHDSYALLMESEKNSTRFQGYTPIDHYPGMSDSECLGYIFPNIDSDNDLVIDGMELVLGTDPNNADSDGDKILDGEEYPPASGFVSDPMVFIK